MVAVEYNKQKGIVDRGVTGRQASKTRCRTKQLLGNLGRYNHEAQ